MVIVGLFGLWATAMSPIITPYQSREALSAKAIHASDRKTSEFEPVVMDLDLHGTYDNPFDPTDVSVKVKATDAEGKSMSVSGYFDMDCERRDEAGHEVVKKQGTGRWRAKLSFLAEGRYEVSASIHDRTGTAETKPIEIEVEKPTKSGFASVSTVDKRYFVTTGGKSFYPLGANVCWGGDGGTFNFDKWIPKYAEQGCNYFRIWLSPHWTTFGVEQPGLAKDGKGLGQFSLENLWKIDHVLALARKYDMKVKLCIDSYNMLRDRDGYPSWEDGVFNIANGGVLHSPAEFWQSPEMDRFYVQKLQYLVARYAADPTVFSWELWNEIDISRDMPLDLAKDWHQRMARELHKIDPYHHLVTTSFGNSMGVKDIDLLSDIDYIQTHNYNSPDVVSQVAIQQSRKGNWGKPHYVGEIGADSGGPRIDDDPEGLQIHDPLWISVCMGSSGAAQPWWWDNLIEPKDLYPLFGSVAKFIKGIEWDKEAFRQTQPNFYWKVRPNPLPRKDVMIQGGPMNWEPSPYNKPRVVRISPTEVAGQMPVSALLHGTGNHADCHNPITFACDLDRETTFDVIVTSVSGYGGAKLKIDLDGSTYLTRDFADPDGSAKGDTLHQYDGLYTVTIPAGKHNVVVDNQGQDWLTANYRFRALNPNPVPPLASWAAVGNDVILAWARVEDRTWTKVCVQKEKVAPAPPSIMTLDGLASGDWKVTLWDTWKGEPISQIDTKVGLNGKLKVELPTIETDLAVKAVKMKS
ncbi:MAG: cellulase family glycosylhydrolase [Armatimonadetes bacterium]|nr:cellulase family glycosylhydrolase [Armatimonadota bacterium]